MLAQRLRMFADEHARARGLLVSRLALPALLLLVLPACVGSQPTPAIAPSPTAVTATEDTPTPAAAPEATSTLAPERASDEPGVPDYREGFFVVVDNPLFIPAGASTLGDGDLVLGYEQDGEARAYPVSMVGFHHILNDTVQDKPLLVTF